MLNQEEGLRIVPGARHVTVYYEEGRFGGWPANHGIWNWGDEILVGFSQGFYKDLGDRHHIDRDRPEAHLLARSVDGGETWAIEDPGANGQLLTEGDVLHGTSRPGIEVPELQDSPGGIDFSHPDFAMTLRTDSVDAGVGRFFYSYDRGRSWAGPYRLPNFGAPGIAPRTDYLVNGPSDCLIFITAAKADAEEGWPLCARTTDGGATWELVSWIGPEPAGFSIMPASVRLSETDLLVATRRREGPRRWIEAYLSSDNGTTWQLIGEPVPDAGVGNPPAMLRLRDGRICLVYGYRAEPYSIRVVLSSDGGQSWSKEAILRGDGSSRDIGYVRAVQRPDGRVVAVYYFSDEEIGHERFIAATIWDPSGI
ncbi:MAG: sialidase family protein [Bryobacterales bacterium]|nr:sialidase family protein [Bryobacterales bacterium]